MVIDPRRLPFLLAVGRYGGILAAADELGVTPSAVSQQLARLEQEVGRPLLERQRQGAVLTAAGLAVAEAAEDVERRLNLVQAQLETDEQELRGTVRIGGFQSFLSSIIAPELPGWRLRFPGVRFELIESEQDPLLRMLRSGELEAAVVELDAGDASPTLPAGMIEVPLLDEPWMMVVPSGSLKSGRMDLQRLNLPWVGVDKSEASAKAVRRVRRATGSRARTVHNYASIQMALALVGAGEGVALVPSLALHGVVQRGAEAVEVPGLGMRRIVLRRYAPGGPAQGTLEAVTSLIRSAASSYSFDGASSSRN